MIVVSGPNGTRVFHGPFTIGRAGCDYAIDGDEYVSTLHATVDPDGDGWTITDMGSTNGVWLNGQRVYKAALAKGDRVGIGLRTKLTVVPE